MTDYAFVPGIGDKNLEDVDAVLQVRPNTVSVLVPQSYTLQNFLLALKNGVEILGWDPAGDLLLGAHGSASGDLKLALDDSTAIPANYETLEKVAATKTVNIPKDVRSANTSVRLASCSIGADECKPFLQLLKSVMNNPSSLTAPRFVHFYSIQNNPTDAYEWMSYAFWITGMNLGKDPLPTRDAVVGKFGEANFQYFDGTPVPDEMWEQWIPPAAKLTLKPAIGQVVNTPYPVRIQVSSNLSMVLKTNLVWTSGMQIHDLDPMDYEKVSDIVALLDEKLPKILKYQDSHLYPVPKRYGFKDLHDFIRGWNWKIDLLDGNKMKLVGSRYMYGLQVPITKPGTDEWIFNHYRDGQAPEINFSDSNQPYRLFGVV